MTEISNVKSGSEVVNLKPANVQSAESGGVSRFASTLDEDATANTSVKLEQGQDPLVQAAKAIDDLVGDQGSKTKLRIDKDDDTGRFIYKSVDKESGEVVKQFPPETILEIISHYRSLEGLVVDDRA